MLANQEKKKEKEEKDSWQGEAKRWSRSVSQKSTNATDKITDLCVYAILWMVD